MKVNVLMLISILIVLSISGCSVKTEYIKVPQKCIIPDTQEPIIVNDKSSDVFEASKKCTLNYIKMKEYAEQLKINSEVCK